MTERTEVQLAVTAWLRAEAPQHARPEVLTETIALVSSAAQDRGFVARLVGDGFGLLPKVRWALLVAFASLALAGAVVGIGALARPAELNEVAPSAPPSVPSPRAEYPVLMGRSVELEPGRYSIGLFPALGLSVEVPSGWYNNGDWSVWTSGVLPSRSPSIQFRTVDNVYVDACRREAGMLDPRVGPSVDDFVDALIREPGRGAVGPARDIGIGAFRGTEVTLVAPDDTTSCTMRDFQPWVAPGDVDAGHAKQVMAPGERDTLWVLDIEGTRLVIVMESFPETTDAEMAELLEIRDSIVIEP